MLQVESDVHPTNLSPALTEPSVDDLIEVAGGKFMAATLAARRARQLGSYFSGHTLPNEVPPQVPVRSKHPLSIALDEVVAGKIIPHHMSRAEYLAARDAASAPPPAPEEVPTAPEQ